MQELESSSCITKASIQLEYFTLSPPGILGRKCPEHQGILGIEP